MMGAGLAYVVALVGIEVVLRDRELSFAERARLQRKPSGKPHQKGPTTRRKPRRPVADQNLRRITPILPTAT
ncbi:MAG: hypothetical protein IPJ07_10990 [Acidobacteria bacterium]|nr:hypothetical protein [Acidobacteriota bacterium]